MSASYAWKPATPVDPYGRIQIGMADAIARRMMGWAADDEPVNRDEIDDQELDKDWVPWLEGIKAATQPGSDMHDDAVALIGAIAEFGAIRFEVLR